MAKKTRVEDIDSNFIINAFRRDDMTIPPEARSTPRPKRDTRPARSEIHAPPGVRWYTSHGVRRYPLLEASCSLCSKHSSSSARNLSIQLLEKCRQPCSEQRPPMLFHQVLRKGKLEADGKPNYVRKADFSYPQECKPAINSVFYKKKCDYFVCFCFFVVSSAN